MAALFALDQNFPQPIIEALNEFIPEVQLHPIRSISHVLTEVEDWELLLSLHHDDRSWAGLITTDSSMLNLPKEMAVLRQTNLTLVVARASGHDPIKATGLLLTHLGWISQQSSEAEPQVWVLDARNRPGRDPWEFIERIALHQSRSVDDVWRESQLTRDELAQNPLDR